MDKQIVFEQSKNALYALIDDLTLKNYVEQRPKIDKYLDFIQALQELPVISFHPITESTNSEQQPFRTLEENALIRHQEAHVVSQKDESTEAQQPAQYQAHHEPHIAFQHAFSQTESILQQNDSYRFERKLRGGFLQDLEGGCYIPEMVVRELGIEHGDLLEIENKRVFGDQTRYTFKVAEKGSGDDPSGRVEFKYCIVEEIGGTLCVSRQMSGEDLKLDGVPFSFVLKRGDVFDLRLAKGDIVDIAYYENRPDDTMKVVWKHDSTKIEMTSKALEKSCNKATVKESPKQTKELPIKSPELFKGKKVLVVGAKPKEAGYKSILESLGSTVEVFAGTESKARTRGAIQKSDAVVMVTAYLGHGKSSGSPQVVDMCKKAKVPFGFVDNMGNQSFLLGVEEVLMRSREGEEPITA